VGVPVGISPSRLPWLPSGEKNVEDIFIRFDTTHERDGHTHRHTPHHGIGRAYASHRAAKTSYCATESRLLRVQANGQSNEKGRFSTTHSGKTTGPISMKLDI